MLIIYDYNILIQLLFNIWNDVSGNEYVFINYNDVGINQFFEMDIGFVEFDGGIIDYDFIIDVCYYVFIDCILGVVIW